MKDTGCEPQQASSLSRKELYRSERKHKVERNLFVGAVAVLALSMLVSAWFARDTMGYTIASSLYTSIGFVLVMMIDQASKKLAKVRREIRLVS